MRFRSPLVPPAVNVALGATSPSGEVPGAFAWSTGPGALVHWDGSAYQKTGAGGVATRAPAATLELTPAALQEPVRDPTVSQLYTQAIAARQMLTMQGRGPAAQIRGAHHLEPAVYSNTRRRSLEGQAATTLPAIWGFQSATYGSLTSTNASYLLFNPGSAVGGSAGWRAIGPYYDVTPAFRGFFFYARAGWHQLTTMKMFIGLCGPTQIGNVNPAGGITNQMGFYTDGTDQVVKFLCTHGSQLSWNTGLTNTNGNTPFDFAMSCSPGGGATYRLDVSVRKGGVGSSSMLFGNWLHQSATLSGISSVTLAPQFWVNTGAVSSTAPRGYLYRVYMESRF